MDIFALFRILDREYNVNDDDDSDHIELDSNHSLSDSSEGEQKKRKKKSSKEKKKKKASKAKKEAKAKAASTDESSDDESDVSLESGTVGGPAPSSFSINGGESTIPAQAPHTYRTHANKRLTTFQWWRTLAWPDSSDRAWAWPDTAWLARRTSPAHTTHTAPLFLAQLLVCVCVCVVFCVDSAHSYESPASSAQTPPRLPRMLSRDFRDLGFSRPGDTPRAFNFRITYKKLKVLGRHDTQHDTRHTRRT